MTTIVFCNIGTRDIRVDDEAGRPPPPRPHGDELNRSYKEIAGRIRFPIITPALQYILKRQNGRLDTAVFIGTDQPENAYSLGKDIHGIPFRDKDTLYYAIVAQKGIKERFAGQIARVQNKRVTMNPSLYDEAFDAFGELLQGYTSDPIETCYVIAVGGTPACNTALVLQGVRLFGERCRVVYTPENGVPYELQVGRQVLDVLRENTALHYLERHDFSAARPLLADRGLHEGLLALVDYARARINFDFDQAQQYLQRAINRGQGESRQFALRIAPDLEQVLKGDEAALIGEVYQNARICWQSGRYVDFLGRAFRFQEAVLRHHVGRIFNLGTDQSNKEQQKRFVAYIEGNHDLLDYLAGISIDGRPLNYTTINILLLSTLLDYVLERGHNGDAQRPLAEDDLERLRLVEEILGRIRNLSELRNKSIIAHGFAGISQERILDDYNRGRKEQTYDPLEDMTLVCGALGIAPANSFTPVAAFITNELRKS